MRFAAVERFEFANGAVGWRPGGAIDCLGPYAKVQNCQIEGTAKRLTCYATRYGETHFCVPARTRYRGKHIGGYFSVDGSTCVFIPSQKYLERLEGALIEE